MAEKPNPRSPSTRPWHPAAYTPDEVYALQNLERGQANEVQQKLALNFIVRRLCGTYDNTFMPDSDRETVFAEAKRHVGLELVKLINMPRAFVEAMRVKAAKSSSRNREESSHG